MKGQMDRVKACETNGRCIARGCQDDQALRAINIV